MPLSCIGGVLTLVLFIMHGSLYALNKTDSELKSAT
jgi:cytochrome bd-type quinol oxidase subunit 2